MIRHTFRAMGTPVELLVEADESPETWAVLWQAEEEFHRLDRLLSRFRSDSELSELNRVGWIVAGPDLLRVTQLALDARERTRGRFDPTVHDALVACGYDRTFREVDEERDSPVSTFVRGGGRITVDVDTGIIELDSAASLDLGGIGKGYAVDLVCQMIAPAGPCLVNAGGDVAVQGVPEQGMWPVGVDTPDGTVSVGLTTGAMATSGRDVRRWRRSGEELHHLIDPFTGRPAETGLLRVTVIAGNAVEAEIFAKAFFLGGEVGAVQEADERRIPSLLVTQDGRTVWAGGLRLG